MTKTKGVKIKLGKQETVCPGCLENMKSTTFGLGSGIIFEQHCYTCNKMVQPVVKQ